MEILTAFVRENAPKELKKIEEKEPLPKLVPIDPQKVEGEKPPKLRIDIQAALTVIGRRNRKHEQGNKWFREYQWINLRDTNIAAADLGSYDWQGVRFDQANLQGANLTQANLQKANLTEVNLQEVDVYNANLQKALLMGANLQGASLMRANLKGAYLCRANLQGVRNLLKQQIELAYGDSETLLPPGWTRPAHWTRVDE